MINVCVISKSFQGFEHLNGFNMIATYYSTNGTTDHGARDVAIGNVAGTEQWSEGHIEAELRKAIAADLYATYGWTIHPGDILIPNFS